MLHLMVHLTVQSRGKPKDTSEGALKDALSDLHIDVKKVHLRLHLEVAFDGAFESRSEGAPKGVLRDLYKYVLESSFVVEIKSPL